MPARSAARPMSPSSASISRTSGPCRSRRWRDCTTSPRRSRSVGDQRRARADPRRRGRRLGPGMAAPHDNDIEPFHGKSPNPTPSGGQRNRRVSESVSAGVSRETGHSRPKTGQTPFPRSHPAAEAHRGRPLDPFSTALDTHRNLRRHPRTPTDTSGCVRVSFADAKLGKNHPEQFLDVHPTVTRPSASVARRRSSARSRAPAIAVDRLIERRPARLQRRPLPRPGYQRRFPRRKPFPRRSAARSISRSSPSPLNVDTTKSNALGRACPPGTRSIFVPTDSIGAPPAAPAGEPIPRSHPAAIAQGRPLPLVNRPAGCLPAPSLRPLRGDPPSRPR